MKRAIYPGSFDPITFGHLDIIKRASGLCDELIIGVLNNKQKNPLFSTTERVNMIRELTENLGNVSVESFEGLTVDFARAKNAQVIIRGLRAVTDFENEIQLAQSNKVQYPEIETLFMTTSLQYSYLSSTVAKEFASYGGDISLFVPSEIIPLIERKFQDKEK
ncbi:MAG: pantetheine-phosphate adenylyltransferase [Pseudobutyrivibrio sp.]|nr:pantetheine-phosphate adenylyltransferase [Pseudobutyrivibrio sp.]